MIRRGSHVYKSLNFGLSLEQFDALLKSQDNCCAICLTTDWGVKGPSVDHDHFTNEIRGILCARCNLGLGHFRDAKELLQRAVTYLDKTCHEFS